MSESETTEVAGQDTKVDTSPRKRVRHRKKQLYENILKQMEFYFSDANLSKDRFLGDLVKSDPYVPIDVFLKFNKIRSMTREINDIAKAMKNSTLLELSEDRLKVCRKTPVLPYDADARTVYVESIPVTASREWLQRVFSDYGIVTYISLPKFKNSHKIKGYGFIEFLKPEDAQKCLYAFTKMGCKLPTCMPPEDLSSIKMFSVEGTSDSTTEKVNDDENEPPKKKKKNKEKKHTKNLELKLEHAESETDKTPTPSEETKSIVSDLTPVEEKTTDVSKDELTSQDESKTDSPQKKKTRKRTAKEKSKAKNGHGPNEAPKGALWGLQVLSKSEWKALRNKYLNLQRKYMKEMKANLQNKRYDYSEIPAPAESSVETEHENPQDLKEAKKPPLERIPGVFVKEILSEPCTDVRHVKRTVKTNIHALHVDAKEGQSEIIIRFDSAKAAEEYCVTCVSARVLTAGESLEQWSAAAAARARARARRPVRWVRARCPPPAPAPAQPQPTATHIRFDDEP